MDSDVPNVDMDRIFRLFMINFGVNFRLKTKIF